LIVTQHVDSLAAIVAGALTFFTPCTLPLLPAWLALVAGEDWEAGPPAPGAAVPSRWGVVLSTLLFIVGFGAVFVAMGAMASWLGNLLWERQAVLRWAGAAVMALFGLHLLGLLPFRALMAEKRFRLKARPAGLAGALVVGMAFAAGWTPCSGPVLASMLSLAWTEASLAQGVRLLALFSLGLGLPFLALSVSWTRLWPRIRRLGRLVKWTNRILGVMMLALAVLVALDRLSVLNLGY
jgi:cytochrome c-type biogenesis protein